MGDNTGFAQVAAAGFADDLARHGDRLALRAGDLALSHAELDDSVQRAAEELRATGARQLVHLRPAPTVDFVVAWLAVLRAGHVALLGHDTGLAAAYGASLRRAGGAWQPTGVTPPALHPDLRLLLSTSGSTGSPKLVRLSATNVDSNARAIADYLDLSPEDVGLTTLPLDYCYGLSVLHSHLAAGASVVLDDRSVTDPGLWADARAAGVTSVAGVPYTFDLLGATGWPQLPTLRRVTQAGGRMAPDRVRALAEQGRRDGWDLVVMYGQTEATARMAWLPPALGLTRPEAVGIAIPGGRFRLEPVEGAAPGVGELVYAGPNVMMGYAERPADLARDAELDELRTGDLARLDEDGIVQVVGRRSRFAKLFGQRIDLDRVQTLLALGGYDAACAEAADGSQLVVAVPGDPDPLLLAEVAAATATDTGLPPHAIRVVPVGSLPRRANGKVDHQAVGLLERALEGEAPASTSSIALLFERVLGRSVGPEDSFVGLGGDSLSYVELALRLETVLGRLPSTWPRMEVAQLSELAAASTTARRGSRRWAEIETGIVLRAVGILAIVGSHTNLWTVVGGAHVLLAVAGANFVRFHLADEGPRRRLRRVARAASRVAVPSVLWIGTVTVVAGTYPWRSVVLLNDLTGGRRWSEPAWHYWFVEVVLLLCVTAGVLTSIPAVMRFERRHRFLLASSLTAVTLVPRLWTETGYGGDVIHSSAFVAWLFTVGWAAAVARTMPQRLLVSTLALVGVWGFTGDVQRDAIIAAGVLALIWLRTVPWPRVLVRPTGTLAAASLFVYLTHWQVYPHFEDWWPLGGLLASLAVGIAVARLVSLVPAWTGLIDRVRPGYAPAHLHRQEVR
ncbi:AMP-binding protein [Nocardioides caeni]|uniref:AMP-dependent synthetase n=1 Tax=Nocardioides caeni TaxID=574700 RepID=A0A4S8NDL8_9ACTN|nr:AMP-binding protein [Nocardioides caeni]THV13014.1 AMP-dependent synthetase [Nocardioides caeni]